MGFISSMADKGSIGSTARWVIKNYDILKSKYPKKKDNEIFEELSSIRHAAFFGNKKKKNVLIQQSKISMGITGFIMDILTVEAELNKNDGDIIEDLIKPIWDTLKKTNYDEITKFGNNKFNELGPPHELGDGEYVSNWHSYIYDLDKKYHNWTYDDLN